MQFNQGCLNCVDNLYNETNLCSISARQQTRKIEIPSEVIHYSVKIFII